MSGAEAVRGSGAGAGTEAGTSGGAKTAGAFDVRVVIAALIGVFGIVLLIMGLVNSSDADLAKEGGVNANLWSGIVMVVVGLGFAAWARLRPIVVAAAPGA